jgi:signal transduction histidine kinase
MIRLRTRILTAYLAALLPVAVGFGWWASERADREFDAELGVRLADHAAVIAAQYTNSPAAGRIARLEPDSEASIERLREGLEVVRVAAGLRRVRLVDLQRRTLVDTNPDTPAFAEAFDLASDAVELERAAVQQSATASVRFYAEDGTPFKRGYAPVLRDDAIVAFVVVEGSAAYFTRLHTIERTTFGAGTLALLVTILATLFVSRRITAPLSRLSDAARRIGAGDLQTPIDVDERDEIGQLAAALRSMQQSLAAREEESQMMLAGIAHEVRNPLAGMELFVGLLEETIANEPASPAREERAGYAGRVRRELGYLSRVVEEFLAYARERTLEVAATTHDGLLRPVIEHVLPLAEAGGLTWTVEIAEPNAGVSGDLDGLRGVVQNLLLNAVQACRPGDGVVLRARQRGAFTEVEVEDTGAGMPPDVLAEIFRPFFTTREKGTGLGLPLARKVVERHRGTLEVTSTPGRGTTVRMRVPFDADALPAQATPSRGGGLRPDPDDVMIG